MSEVSSHLQTGAVMMSSNPVVSGEFPGEMNASSSKGKTNVNVILDFNAMKV